MSDNSGSTHFYGDGCQPPCMEYTGRTLNDPDPRLDVPLREEYVRMSEEYRKMPGTPDTSGGAPPDTPHPEPLQHSPEIEAVLDELSALREWAIKVCAAGEHFDRKAEQYNGADGFVSGYRMPTGPWHRILGLIRSCPFRPALESEWRTARLSGEQLVDD